MKNKPKEIHFVFLDKKGIGIPSLIVFFRVVTKNKNSYSIEPQISNSEGVIILTEEYIKSVISDYMNKFPMDYNDNINNCTDLEVFVESKKKINSRIKIMEEFYPDKAKFLSDALLESNNDKINIYKKFSLPTKENKMLIEI